MAQQQFYETVQREQEYLETSKGRNMTTFLELRKINVNDHTEKKGQLTYLSWSWAVDTLLQHDPQATWIFPEPKTYNDTMMVFCEVTALGKTMRMQLPVMDNRNAAIVNPDTRKISDATMRCLAKCIACFGIGLYIYAGEDLPQVEPEEIDTTAMVNGIMQATTVDGLQNTFTAAWQLVKGNKKAELEIMGAKDKMKLALTKGK